ncbi:MAG: DUF2723 domain-containing protein [Bacteroidetes bacterium]|nr:DUF2723 domain-containing protein [Bacteroidota bacterium]
MNFKKANNLLAWLCCLISAIVYFKTVEPTVSFWDCGEFLSCAAKLEVAHSPGAPLFMLIQRVFSLLAFGNKEHIALVINLWSCMASALTILFLFWTITRFAQKLVVTKNAEPDKNQSIVILASGIIGSLAYAYSDTFWSSAVEAEVYATSSLFTAMVLWVILKWESKADEKYADKWIVLIGYLIGLSVGIHLLNLLAVPALAMVYYFRRYEVTAKGSVIAFVIGTAILLFVQFGVLQGLPSIAKWMDIFFVNDLHLPFDSGLIVCLLLLAVLLGGGFIYARKKSNYNVYLGTAFLSFIILGFLSYAVPMIRSRADVPVDMVNPDNATGLVSYLQREQYGQQPLLYGPDFTSIRTGWKNGDAQYRATKTGYKLLGYKTEPVFEEGAEHFFPRLWDVKNAQQINFYRSYLDLQPGDVATSSDDIKFFRKYQLNWMWWRYLMWNYAGKQNDFEGQGEPKNGNWLCGVGVIDNNIRGLGDADKMSDGYSNNAAHNKLYLLPFILGLAGLIYQFRRNRKDAVVIITLFFFTGFALAVYLNMAPMQARERDYAFAGSMYAYAIWIGLGVVAVSMLLKRFVKNQYSYVSGAICLIVPLMMLKEEWNDHDRSHKTLARDVAYNMLVSCEPNAILFTFGDNYTYPLWYMQEVEEFRTDVRVINLGLLDGSWYIDQLTYKINKADAVPMLWKSDDYYATSSAVYSYNKNTGVPADKYINLSELCSFVNTPASLQETESGGIHTYPAKNFFLQGLTTEALLSRHFIKENDTASIVNEMKFTCSKDNLTRGNMALYNIIASIAAHGWNRPVYFGDGITPEDLCGMQDYVRMEGCVYRLLPFKYKDAGASQEDMGSVDADKSFALYTGQYKWGGAERKDVYFDAKNRLALTGYRVNAGRIAADLIAQGKKQEGLTLLDHMMKNISEHSYFYDATLFYTVIAYYKAGAKDKAAALALKITKNMADDVRYIKSLNDDGMEKMQSEMKGDFSLINALGKMAQSNGDTKTATAIHQQLDQLNNAE